MQDKFINLAQKSSKKIEPTVVIVKDFSENRS